MNRRIPRLEGRSLGPKTLVGKVERHSPKRKNLERGDEIKIEMSKPSIMQ
jgi:hypothetical protein